MVCVTPDWIVSMRVCYARVPEGGLAGRASPVLPAAARPRCHIL